MKRFLIFSGIALGILIVLWWGVSFYRTSQTKAFSPEDNVVFHQDDLTIKVFYNRPYKKGRDIFGSLVPYNKVWRTGANEATTFETNKNLNIEGKLLPKGKYSLWTIPKQDSWTIIFNSEHGQWGINSEGEANRNKDLDILTVDVAALQQEKEFEQFTIAFNMTGEEAEMVLLWDKTLVSMPFSFD
jgi:hypothetical protein